LLFFPSFSSLCKVVLCIHLYQSKERGWNTGAGRWVDSLYYIFMKMKFVKEVAVSFLLLTHSCCLEENLDSAPPADTSGRSRRRSLCMWILILQRDTVTVKPIPKLPKSNSTTETSTSLLGTDFDQWLVLVVTAGPHCVRLQTF